MWSSQIPKLKIAFPSEVIVSSDYRTYRNLAFYKVLAWQGSSFCVTRMAFFLSVHSGTFAAVLLTSRPAYTIELDTSATRNRLCINVIYWKIKKENRHIPLLEELLDLYWKSFATAQYVSDLYSLFIVFSTLQAGHEVSRTGANVPLCPFQFYLVWKVCLVWLPVVMTTIHHYPSIIT